MNQKIEKFERLAEKRVTSAIKTLRLIGNLSNKRNYCYTDDHVKEIVDALEMGIRKLKARFKEDTNQESSSFKFKKTGKHAN